MKTGHRRLPKTPETNPVREAYRLWNTALVDGRSSWDQVAVLSLVRPELFKLKHTGRDWSVRPTDESSGIRTWIIQSTTL